MQTIGERLEEARKKKAISIREAAEATKIRGDYLQKFESNQFDIGLTEIYVRGFLRTYANYLKLPAERIVNDYAGLGLSDSRPRVPSREVYGRMDISTTTTSDPTSRTPAGGEPPAEPAPTPRSLPPRTRTGSSLPTGPDPATVFKYLKIGGGVLGLLVVFYLLKSLWPSGKASAAASSAAGTAAAVATTPRAPTLGLVALSPVQVSVRRKNLDGSDGDVLFTGLLLPDQGMKSIPRPGPVFIEASAAENLLIDVNGSRKNLGQLLGTGYQRGELPGP